MITLVFHNKMEGQGHALRVTLRVQSLRPSLENRWTHIFARGIILSASSFWNSAVLRMLLTDTVISKKETQRCIYSCPCHLNLLITVIRTGKWTKWSLNNNKNNGTFPPWIACFTSSEASACWQASLLPETHALRFVLPLQHLLSLSAKARTGWCCKCPPEPRLARCCSLVLSVFRGLGLCDVRLRPAQLCSPPLKLLHRLQQGRALQL